MFLALLLLVVINLSYFGTGLSDSLLGSAWPAMQPVLSVPISFAGILSVLISCATVCSSLFAGRLLRRCGTGLLVSCCVLLTAAALLGFSVSTQFLFLCLCAVPYGLGAGAIDAALNHYVAVHYEAKHMNWLYCIWGIGASCSPYVMQFAMQGAGNWQGGYRAVAVYLLCMTAALFLTLPLWRRSAPEDDDPAGGSMRDLLLHGRGVRRSLMTFFCDCALENTVGLWAGSYSVCGSEGESSALPVTGYYLGLTAGRLVSGFLAEHICPRRLLRMGLFAIGAGIVFLLPMRTELLIVGFFVIGFGCAPVYPSLLHETPLRFGGAQAQTMIGLQTASGYLGATLMPPLFGLIADRAGMSALPQYLLILLSMTMLLTAPPLSSCSRRRK